MKSADPVRVLYVDDSPFDRALVRDALEEEGEGFRLVEASHRGELDSVLAGEFPFDLVLSDFNILGMTGLEVVGAVHERHPDIPIIIVTGTGSEEVAVKALKAGAEDYVIKQPQHIRRLPQTIRGVLERRRLESSLEATRVQLGQLRHLEAVGRLAGGIAHDFNNLLTVITANAELLSSVEGPDGPPAEELRDILQAAAQATELTRHLMEFSSGAGIPLERVDPVRLIQETLPLLNRSLGSEAELLTRIPPELPSLLTVPARFQQVIMNLGLNARDALAEGGRAGTIRLEADLWTPPPIASGGREDGNGLPPTDSLLRHLPGEGVRPLVRIRVSDNGCGMPPEVVERIFEPFFTTKAIGRGTGLGLASAFGTVRQAGGTILVESEVGKGSTFTVLLPRASDVEADRV